MSDVPRSYTPAEKRQRAWLVLRGAKQALADAVDPQLEGKIERIDARAEDRGLREAEALHRQNEKAKDELASAKAAARAARGDERTGARAALQKAEQRARATERAMRTARL